MTVLRSGSATDVGRVRSVNEDLALESPTLFAVADGMGGHAGGEVAARVAVDAFQGDFSRNQSAPGLVAAVQQANLAVWERSRSDPDVRGMGTTLTAAALVSTAEGDRLVVANVGDSRAYRFRGGELIQLTNDHSVAEELVARGELTEAEAAVHPHRHILTRALGVGPEVEVDAWEIHPVQGDRYLLSSDGLTNEISADRLATALARTADPQDVAEALVRMANEHGGNDNITVVVVDVVAGDGDRDGEDTPGRSGEVPLTATAGPPAPAGAAPEAPAAAPGPVAAPDVPAADPPPPGPPVPEEAVTELTVAPLQSDATGPEVPVSPPRPEAPRRLKGPSWITVRTVIFLGLLVGLSYAVFYVVRWYNDNSYFVQATPSGQITVYQGRIGGLLWIKPKVAVATGVTTSQVPQFDVADLQTGVEEPTLQAATAYVKRLQQQGANLPTKPAGLFLPPLPAGVA